MPFGGCEVAFFLFGLGDDCCWMTRLIASRFSTSILSLSLSSFFFLSFFLSLSYYSVLSANTHFKKKEFLQASESKAPPSLVNV